MRNAFIALEKQAWKEKGAKIDVRRRRVVVKFSGRADAATTPIARKQAKLLGSNLGFAAKDVWAVIGHQSFTPCVHTFKELVPDAALTEVREGEIPLRAQLTTTTTTQYEPQDTRIMKHPQHILKTFKHQ